ncbi:MAG: DoxX family protein [Flavobacteriaceae bacterium]|nr:DoxX family protein [Flavobacteriaceae bacterium]
MTKVSVNQRSIQIFRVMLSGIFFVASLSHLFNIEKTLQKLDQARFKGIAYFFGDPTLMIILSGIAMLLAGLSLMAGFKTKWAAILLAACLIPITITVQVGQTASLGPLFKNIAIFGGLLFFILNDFNKTQKT